MINVWYSPAFSSLLTNRREGLVVFSIGGIYLVLNLIGVPVWVCPIRAAIGIPCPGCGLTTAIMQFLRGDFLGSFKTHAFAPVFLFAIFVMATNLLLPLGTRQRLVSFVYYLETHFGVTSWVLLAFFVYWGIRLIGLVPFPKTF